ncbi:MAG: PAS domain-containing protein [Bacteroidota bacterium]
MDPKTTNIPGFLSGAGEMGELTRNYNWEQTSLGKPSTWPVTLQNTVGIVLHSAFPQFLFWGKELITFYNDPFRPSLGIDGKHPAVGKKGEEVWPEIWDFIGPLIKQVMTTGAAAYFEDQLVPFFRNGKIEEIYWTFSYSPAYGNDGEIAGVFVTCTETTEKIKALAIANDTASQLQFAINAADLGTWELNPQTNKFRGNARLKEWFGLKPEEEIELSLATNVIAEKDRQKVKDAIAKALRYESGGHYDIDYTIQNPITRKEIIVKAKGKAYFNEKKEPYTFSGTLQDVTAEAEMKEHLQLLRNTVPAMIFYLDSEQRYKSYNGVFMDWFNVNASEILGKTVREFIGEAAYEIVGPYLAKAYQGEQVQFHTHAPKRITGEKWLNVVYTPHKNSDGNVIGVIVHATDITEYLLTNQKIEQKEKELRDLITASPIGICVVSGIEARIQEVNEQFIIISGKNPEQFVNATYWEVFPEVAEAFAPVLENVFKTGIKFTTAEAELVLIRKGVPETMFATFEYIPIFDRDNRVAKILVMVVEVTQQTQTRKKIEEAVVQRTKELAESNLLLRRSNEELEQFAYIASHDLQEPIRKISTFTQLLEHSLSKPSEKSKDYISKIYNSTDRMSKLVRDVLAYSRIRDKSNEFETVDLNTIIETVKQDFEITIAETHAAIETANLPTIEAIQGQMIQLFGNLMSNALKYRTPGINPSIKISVSAAKQEKVAKRMALDPNKKYWHIEFSDNGIGFNEEHADKIFRIFQRLHGKTEYEGTGVGLAICLKIVHNHQGHISAAVGENGGAVFNILLPAIQAISEVH